MVSCGGKSGGDSGAHGDPSVRGAGECPGVVGVEAHCADDPTFETAECNTCIDDAVESCSLEPPCDEHYYWFLDCAARNGCMDNSGYVDFNCAAVACDQGFETSYSSYLTCLDGCPQLLSCAYGTAECNTCGLDEFLVNRVWVTGICDPYTDTCVHRYLLLYADGTYEESYLTLTGYAYVDQPWNETDRVTSHSTYRGTWTTDCTYIDLVSCGGQYSSRLDWYFTDESSMVASTWIPDGGGWMDLSTQETWTDFGEPSLLPVSPLGYDSACP